MKKVLFVLQSIGIGGSMTSMINLLKLLGKTEYSIDLLIMCNGGELQDKAKEVANMLKKDTILESITLSRQTILNQKLYHYYFIRAFIVVISRIFNMTTSEFGYNIASKKYSNKYDCVIAYQESTATNFVQYIKADKKIAWIHNDYQNVSRMYSEKELVAVYSSFNKIVCVSSAGEKNFIEESNIDPNKFVRIYNTFDINQILVKSTEYKVERDEDDKKIFVSIGRFARQKRFDRVVNVAEKLRDLKYCFKWYIVGGGILYDEIKKSIEDKGLSDCVILAGVETNPFPYIKLADAMVITSDFEAHPMVATEALILSKPVISTNYESACEVISDEINGLICNNSSCGILEAVKSLLDYPKLLIELKNNAELFSYDNDSIVLAVKSLLNNNNEGDDNANL